LSNRNQSRCPRLTILLALIGLLATGPSAVARPRLPTSLAHTDPRAIDRLPEQPAPRGGTEGQPLSGLARVQATASSVLGAVPEAWCGAQRATDDTAHELANGTNSYHAIYALPQDSVNRFATVASTLQADAFEASELLERLYRRAIRFDMGTNCGPQYLDISVVRLPQRAAALSYQAGNPDALMSLIAADLRTQGFNAPGLELSLDTAASAQKNFLVWLEDVKPAPGVCGLGNEFADARRDQNNFNNFGGKLAVVFRRNLGFCNSNTVRHEIGHNLGALQSAAPHAFDGAHCNDAYEDTMCYPLAPQVSTDNYQGEYFDYRNDDYWDPPGGALTRWTVNLSRFICPDITCNVPARAGLSQALSPLDIFDHDGDLAADLLASCPEGIVFNGELCPANTTTDTGSEVGLHQGPGPQVAWGARRHGRGRWRITIRVTGAGKALVTVRCRRGHKTVRVFRRRLTAPRTVRKTVRCDGRPTARAID
jgi:hypothetical protein